MWIKICGMNSEAAVAAALQAGAQALGFVFTSSPRRVTLAKAVQLAAPARGRALCVAVTLHPETSVLVEILKFFKPDILQTDWSDLIDLDLPAELSVLPVQRSGAMLVTPLPSRLLYEGPISGVGVTADWTNAQILAYQTQLVLAGGLNASNVATAIAAVRPFGVDVSSGVESAPGKKSVQKIFEFVSAARAAL